MYSDCTNDKGLTDFSYLFYINIDWKRAIHLHSLDIDFQQWFMHLSSSVFPRSLCCKETRIDAFCLLSIDFKSLTSNCYTPCLIPAKLPSYESMKVYIHRNYNKRLNPKSTTTIRIRLTHSRAYWRFTPTTSRAHERERERESHRKKILGHAIDLFDWSILLQCELEDKFSSFPTFWSKEISEKIISKIKVVIIHNIT